MPKVKNPLLKTDEDPESGARSRSSHERRRDRVAKLQDRLLEKLETNDKITVKELIAALTAIARIEQIMQLLALKRADSDEQSGSRVRQYAGAFSADAASRRKTHTGAGQPEPDDWFERTPLHDDGDGEGDSAAE